MEHLIDPRLANAAGETPAVRGISDAQLNRRELARLAWQLQHDVDDLRSWAEAQNESVGSTQSASEMLERIDRRLVAVHGQTSELVARVPKNLAQTMTELKEALLDRLAQASAPNQSNDSGLTQRRRMPNPANHSNHSNRAPNHATHSNQSPGVALQLLTPQERRVFQLCFQSGFLTYDEIAKHLDVTAVAAKNLVNGIFQSDGKRSLFAKEYNHGSARVGIHSGLEKRILTGGVYRDETEGPVEPSAATAKNQVATRRFPARATATASRAKARRTAAQAR